MKFTIPCTYCRKTYEVEDRLVGRRVKCKDCGEVFIITRPPEKEDVVDLSAFDSVEPTIPLAPPPIPSAYRPPVASPPSRGPYYAPPPVRKKSRMNWTVGGSAAGGGVALIVLALRIGIHLWLMNQNSVSTGPSILNPPSATSNTPAPDPPSGDMRRQQTADNLREIYAGLQQYHAGHGDYPVRLEELQTPGDIVAKEHSPFGPLVGWPDYVYYRFDIPRGTPGHDSILVADRAEGHVERGVTVLRGDGAVEYIDTDNLSAAMAASKAYYINELNRTQAQLAQENFARANQHQTPIFVPPPLVITPPQFPSPVQRPATPAEQRPWPQAQAMNDEQVATNIPDHAWSAEPDPPSTPVSINPNIRHVLTLSHISLYYPKQPGNFVLVHEPGETERANTELWNLKTGVRVSRFSLGDDLQDPILSPDGRYFAGRVMGGRGEVSTYQLISTLTGKVAQILTAPPGADGNIPFPIGFADAGQLLTVADGIEVWDIRQGVRLRQLGKSTKLESTDMFAVSATGKLAAWICLRRNTISLYSTGSGKLLGTSALPDPNQRQTEWSDALKAAEFSPDGREIALLVGGKHIYVWSVADGHLAGNFTLADMVTDFGNRFNRRENTMCWMPDCQGWLVNGDRVIDRATGLVIYNMPDFHESMAEERGPRQLADAGHILLSFESNTSHRSALETLPFDADLIQKNRISARGGAPATAPATQAQ